MIKEVVEEFRDIPGYEGYQVSNLGNVKSLSRKMLRAGKYPFISKERILKPGSYRGYYFVSLRINNKTYCKKVHQLVSMSFLNHTPNGNKIVVDHINNIRTDNRLENLQLISNRENTSKDRKDGSSKYTGVDWHKERNKWRSRIKINKKEIYIGRFNTELEAHNAYQNKLKEIQNEG